MAGSESYRNCPTVEFNVSVVKVSSKICIIVFHTPDYISAEGASGISFSSGRTAATDSARFYNHKDLLVARHMLQILVF